MVKENADQLTEYLSDRAGDQLRVVVRYTPDQFELHYLRDDIPEPGVLQRMEEVLENISEGRGKQHKKMVEEFGVEHTSLKIRERGVIFHFPQKKGRGVLVSFEPGVARQLGSFIRECLKRM